MPIKSSSLRFTVFQVRQVSDEGKGSTTGERKIAINVFNYFKTESSLLKRNALVEMTVKATGASATSVK